MDITETLVRSVGGIFELGGLLFVVLGIYGLHRLFGGKPLPPEVIKGSAISSWNRLKSLWFRLIRRPRPPIELVVSDVLHLHSSSSVTLTGKVGPGDNLTLEEKIAWLLSMVGRLQDENAALVNRIEAEAIARSAAIDGEAEARAQAEIQLRDEITNLATGDLNRQFWGVVALGFGLILQVWSQEIAHWL